MLWSYLVTMVITISSVFRLLWWSKIVLELELSVAVCILWGGSSLLYRETLSLSCEWYSDGDKVDGRFIKIGLMSSQQLLSPLDPRLLWFIMSSSSFSSESISLTIASSLAVWFNKCCIVLRNKRISSPKFQS